MANDPLKLLVVDDDPNILATLAAGLEALGTDVTRATSGESALALLDGGDFDVVLTDVRMEGMTGVDLVRQGRKKHPRVLFVVMTAYASYEKAVGAIKEGAFDYLPKPFSVDQLEHVLAKVRKIVELQRENDALRGARHHPEYFSGYTSAAMRRLEEVARKVAPTDATVLLVGESGTGKSEFARILHARSPRAAQPFVEVNCASLTESLLESELFGHVKGAFTGATHDKAGKLELAAGGTVFLDEVGELSLSGQSKLLRFLQEKIVERVGSSKPVPINARVIAATNKKLDEEVAHGKFREDLYYRLNVFECSMVPLRQRADDVPVLIHQLLMDMAAKTGLAAPPALPSAVRQALLAYQWPGNIRELRNVIERMVILSSGDLISIDDLPAALRRKDASTPGLAGELKSLKDIEHDHIRAVLSKEKNQEKAAAILGITTVTLWRKRKEYGLD